MQEEAPKKSPNALLVKAGIALLFILLVSAIGFLLWKKSNMPLSSPTSDSISEIEMDTEDTTIDWKGYSNSKYYYQFKCPSDAEHKENDVSGNGITIPFHQETCTQGENQVTLQVLSLNARSIEEDIDQNEGLTGMEFDLPSGKEKVRLVGHNKEFVNQIISTFEVIGS